MKLSSVLFYNTYFPCSLFNEALILSLTKFEDVINAERIEKKYRYTFTFSILSLTFFFQSSFEFVYIYKP